MWKIATVMMATAMFAGLLIAEPYGSLDTGRPTPGLTQTALGSTQTEPSQAPSVVQHENQSGNEVKETPAPAPTTTVVDQLKKLIVSVVPTHGRTTVQSRGTRHITKTTTGRTTHRTRTA